MQKKLEFFRKNPFYFYLLLLSLHISGLVSYTLSNKYLFFNSHAFEYFLPGDYYIPFLPIWIYPYFYWYIYMAIPLTYAGLEAFLDQLKNTNLIKMKNFYKKSFSFLFLNKREKHPLFIDIFLSSIPLLILNISFFFIFPSYCTRPIALSDGSFSFTLFSFIWNLDYPLNALPSMHVSLTILFSLILINYFHKNLYITCLAIFSSIMISLSTLFTYQHHLIDVIVGCLLAYLAFLIGKYLKIFLNYKLII